MAKHQITFQPDGRKIETPTGSLISEAIRAAGLEISQPCGGQGRCGRCAVIVDGDDVRRRSTIRLSPDDVKAGYALACQTVIEGDVTVEIPEQEKIQRRLVTDRTVRKIELPFAYDPAQLQSVRAFELQLSLPTPDDTLDDLARLQRGLAKHGFTDAHVPLPVLRTLGDALRRNEGSLWAVVESDDWTRPQGPARVLDLSSEAIEPLGLAIDIGTTTVTTYLVDLTSGEVLSSAAEYNGQINFGEDVISRIVYAGKNDGLQQLNDAVRQTIHALLERLQKRTNVDL
ncbi:MAG: 2Fe-2S iron-sulfur cluster-binding protein, partial [Anaerolineales bacterium]